MDDYLDHHDVGLLRDAESDEDQIRLFTYLKVATETIWAYYSPVERMEWHDQLAAGLGEPEPEL